MDKITVIDLEPMIIESESLGVKWVHPHIKEWAALGTDGVVIQTGDESYDNSVYLALYENSQGDVMEVCFKSRYMEQTIERYFMEEVQKNTDKKLFSKPYVDIKGVLNGIEQILSNGSWQARQPPATLPKTNKDLLTWCQTAKIKQFHDTTKGNKIASFFGRGWNASVEIFCCMTHYDNEWFSETVD